MIIDGTNAVLGRLAAYAAKELLKGETVEIINSEKIIIIGNPDITTAKYLHRRRIGSPQHGPFFPKKPDIIVRRTIRGMLPYKLQKGRNAMKKLRVRIGHVEMSETVKTLAVKEVKTNFITIQELSKKLGWNK